MIKGCQKKMVIVKNISSDIFDEVYFILKDDRKDDGLKNEDMILEANRIVAASTFCIPAKGNRDLAKDSRDFGKDSQGFAKNSLDSSSAPCKRQEGDSAYDIDCERDSNRDRDRDNDKDHAKDSDNSSYERDCDRKNNKVKEGKDDRKLAWNYYESSSPYIAEKTAKSILKHQGYGFGGVRWRVFLAFVSGIATGAIPALLYIILSGR